MNHMADSSLLGAMHKGIVESRQRFPAPPAQMQARFRLGAVAFGEYLGAMWDVVLPENEYRLPVMVDAVFYGVPVYMDESMPDREFVLEVGRPKDA